MGWIGNTRNAIHIIANTKCGTPWSSLGAIQFSGKNFNRSSNEIGKQNVLKNEPYERKHLNLIFDLVNKTSKYMNSRSSFYTAVLH
jgi:hypothetical protein